jgi:aspartyl-tRNA(Asn)/glutamyl-tRNA(Gln) amidotransferase subunit A
MKKFPTIALALQALRDKKITVLQLVNDAITRIEAEDFGENGIGSFTQTCFDEARDEAKKLDESGDFSGSLAGIPYTLKDVISVEGMKNTAGSKMLGNYQAPYDATVYEKLRDAGAILLGKVNTDEFTMGSSCETSQIVQTKNPWNTKKVPGGSSGGSAAAVAKGFGYFSIGTDTGGSIRQPANFCGITGLKVSYGRVSRSGIISYASSFDSIGPLTQNTQDAAKVLEVIAGNDKKDSTTPEISVPKYSEILEFSEKDTENSGKKLAGKKIGVIKEFMNAKGLDPQIKAEVEKTLELAKDLGAEIEEISLPLTEYAIPTYYLLVKAEASTNLARYDGIRFGKNEESLSSPVDNLQELYTKTREEGFGEEVKRAIMMGTYTLSAGYYDAYYLKAAKVRRLMKEKYDQAFEKVDAIIAPVSPFPAFGIGEKKDDPLEMYLADIFTVTANLVGICGLSIPTGLVGKEDEKLPTGVQILGKAFTEEKILEIGNVLEKEIGFKGL